MRKIILVFVAFLFFFSCAPKQEAKTIYVVRHAEKQLVGDDPELSVAGNARSVKLGQLMEDKEIEHVFSTPTKRTYATVRHVAANSGISIEDYDPKDHDALVKELRKRKGNALVVGHSNTVHHLVNYFVGNEDKYEELEDIEYNFIFMVEMASDGSSKVKRKTFGEF
ncbi:SixA phosphatase family protein [Arthrospiribacter ruber]|uniref:Histidine phosphatase family protein n=1 Tax=Arthrospiribacter ruber TaxID=2487934 RepID=A0A951MF36_9BACT|nr:histidine phosphatase family protein [Arthrospiribacter ruber]MBW3468760.1 histidine phosphatase family protein [Arthrospiribacter ruber]